MYNSNSTSDCLYDVIIKKSLKVDTIPKAMGSYPLLGESYSMTVDVSDKATFDKLFELTPPKLGETEGTSKGSGNGEIALYWLFQHQQNPIKTQDSRSGSKPDLILEDKIGCEVKSFDKSLARIQIGRFGADKENIKLLNVIFGFYFMSHEIDLSLVKKKEVTTTNFTASELLYAFELIYEFITTTDVSLEQGVLSKMRANIDVLLRTLDYPETAEEATKAMLVRIINRKLSIKPGDGGYLVNIKRDGEIWLFKTDLEKLTYTSISTLMTSVEIVQSTIHINFNYIFNEKSMGGRKTKR